MKETHQLSCAHIHSYTFCLFHFLFSIYTDLIHDMNNKLFNKYFLFLVTCVLILTKYGIRNKLEQHLDIHYTAMIFNCLTLNQDTMSKLHIHFKLSNSLKINMKYLLPGIKHFIKFCSFLR